MGMSTMFAFRFFIKMALGVWGGKWSGPLEVGVSLAVLVSVLVWAAVPWLLAASLGTGYMVVWLLPTTAVVFGFIRWRNYAGQFG